MTRQLLIVDQYDSGAFRHVAAETSDGAFCDVLLLGLSADWFRWRAANELPPGVAWRFVEPVTLADEACRRVGDFIVDEVAGLPERVLEGRTLAEWLARAGRTDWWFTETSEKGPYRGPLISQLYRLALIRLVLEGHQYERVWHSLTDRYLADAVRDGLPPPVGIEIDAPKTTPGPPLSDRPLLRYWAQAVRAVALNAIAMVVSRRTAVFASEGSDATFTLFPAWWSGAETASPRERFFSHRESPTPGVFLAWLTGGASLWRRRKSLASACRRERLIPLQRYLGVGDLAALVSPGSFLRLVRVQRLIAQVRSTFCGFPVGPLVVADIRRSLTAAEYFQDRLLEVAATRALASCRPARVFYRAEFQPIEQAVLRGVEDGGQVSSFGFVHFPFGACYLSMRFGPDETTSAGGGSRGTLLRAMPTGLLAIGPAARRHAVDAGFPSGRVAVCGPQRYGRLMETLRSPSPRESLRAELRISPDQPLIVVALAILDADTEALCAGMAAASDAFMGAVVMIRPHPNQPVHTGPVAALGKAWGPDRVRLMPVERDLYDVLPAADILVCIGSMIAFEAMALGVMPILFENPSTYAATSLREFGAGLFVAADAAELGAALTAARINSQAAREKRSHWPSVLQDVFGDLERPLGVQMTSAIHDLAHPQPTC